MKIIQPAAKNALSHPAAAITNCLLVIGQDNTVLSLTDHDRDITFSGYQFLSQPGLSIDGVRRSADLAPDISYMTTGLFEDTIPSSLYQEGYRGAHAELWRVDADQVDNRTLISVGTVGEVTIDSDRIVLEFRGLEH